MTVDSSLIDRIVRGVLHGLHGADAAPPSKPIAVSPASPAASSPARLSQAVITAEVLSQNVPLGANAVAITSKAILTPAALDVVRARRLLIQRAAPPAVVSEAKSKGLALIVAATPVLDRLLKGRASDWRRELLGCPDDAAKLAAGSICRGEADVVVIFARQFHRAACLANRNDRVKAVAVNSVDELRIAREQLRVNVICLDPTNRGDFEVRRWFDAAMQKTA
jgi:hypothetical protein